MKNIRDISIRKKMLLGLGLITLSIFAISYMFWRHADSIAERAENLYKHPLTVRRALGELQTSVLTMQLEYRNVLLSVSQEDHLQAEQKYLIAKTNAEKQFDILNNRYLGPEKDLADLKNSFVRWNMLQSEKIFDDFNISSSNKTLTSSFNNSTILKARQNLTININKIGNFAINKADQFYNESTELNKTLKQNNITYTLIISVLVFIIIYYLNIAISRPLNELARLALKLKKGEMNVRSKNKSQDEFGLLSSAFNEMADSLEKELQIKNKSSFLAERMLNSDDLFEFCKVTLEALITESESQMGSIYLLDEDKMHYTAFCTKGLDREACKPFSARHPEGEFALAAMSGEVGHLKNLNNTSQFKFQLAIGEITPNELITIPIYSSNTMVAVISLFSIYSYSDLNIRLIESIHSTLTSRMNSVLLYKKVTDFNLQLEEKNNELDTQKSELSLMTEELVEQNTELEQQKTQLGEMNQLKTNFLSSMSHELRTPLNSVIALSGVLNRRLNQQIPEEEHSYIGVIERNGKHLLTLINDILDLSRIESGKVEISKSQFSINTLISEVEGMIKPQAVEKEIDLIYINPESAITIVSDYDKCLHVLQNLIGNAVKFTITGGVEISTRVDDDNLFISVIDTGIGISQQDLPFIFDEFRQADGSNSRKFGGTGLGLSIANKYALLLGGNIEVESMLDKGSKFTFKIPLSSSLLIEKKQEAVNQLKFKPAKPSTLRNIKTEGSIKTILLVEDTEAMVVQLVDLLEEQGYNVAVEKSGEAALENIDKINPDAILLDLMMPGIDGLEVLHRIRNRNGYDQIPIMILTAKIISKKELSIIRNNNVRQFLQKGNISKDRFIDEIAILLGKKTPAVSISVPITQPIIINEKIKVLVVEDNPDNMLAIKALISSKCTFLEAKDGKIGVNLTKKYRPHIILMDIAMPGVNGFEALKMIRDDNEIKHIPIIVVTSSAMKGDRQYFLDFGFDGYVSKPIHPETLNKEINKWVKTTDEYTF